MLTFMAVFFGWFAFLSSWVGLIILGVYLLLAGTLFDDKWTFRGVFLLGIPLVMAWGVGVVHIPSRDWCIAIILAYLILGVTWSFFKWLILVTDFKKALTYYISQKFDNDQLGANYRGNISWNELSANEKSRKISHFFSYPADGYKFRTFLPDSAINELNLIPTVSSNKDRVFSWIAYWPFSLINYLFSRLLKDLFDFIVEQLKGVYNAIAKSIMGDLRI